MDYILSKLKETTDIQESTASPREIVEYYRAQIEYLCIFLLGYLWNRNIRKIDPIDREDILTKVERPSLGTLVELCRTLDRDAEFFGATKAGKKALNEYPDIRNQWIGHAFLFESSSVEHVLNLLKSISSRLVTSDSFLATKFDLIWVKTKELQQYKGVRFVSDGSRAVPWTIPSDSGDFNVDDLYAVNSDEGPYPVYLRLSPFIVATSLSDFFIFRHLSDKMFGRADYNQLLKNGTHSRLYRDFCDDISNDGMRRKSANGTILNIYRNNYDKYIETGQKRQIREFLLKNKAFVSATIWGHGGVGKTATVQSLCDDLSREKYRSFEYIVFASAKDRSFSYKSGEIVDIEKPIDSYRNLLNCISVALHGRTELDEQEVRDEIINFHPRLLLVIDDYESFPSAEQELIEELIGRLNTEHHKVLITTRTRVILGEEFATDELKEDGTIDFLMEVLRQEFPELLPRFEADLKSPANRSKIFSVTSGRPLFIFQFAYILAQARDVADTVRHDIKTRSQAVEFLYGRIYEYLSPEAQTLFQGIGRLLTTTDLASLLGKLRYILNMDHDADRFDRAVQELVKLRVIEVSGDDVFHCYSREILQFMQEAFKNARSAWRAHVDQRLKTVGRDRRLNVHQAMLAHADECRTTGRGRQEIEDAYRHVLNQPKLPQAVKLRAILNFASYLNDYRGSQDEAIHFLQEQSIAGDPILAERYATYCWSAGQRSEAVRTLMELFKRPNNDWMSSSSEGRVLQIRGQSLMYRSMTAITRKEALKTRMRMGELTSDERERQNREITAEFNRIYNEAGTQLFRTLREKVDLETLERAARNDIIVGLYQFSAVCIRLQKFDDAEDICRYLLNSSSFMLEAFQRRINDIQYYRSQMP